MKFVGAIFLLSGFLWIAYLRVRSIRSRPQSLQELANALDVLDSECSVRMASLPEALRCASCTGKHISDFFSFISAGLDANLPLKEVWTAGLPLLRFLNEQERHSILALQESLGKYDTQAQKQAILYCSAQLREHARMAQTQIAVGMKLSFGLSLVCGTMLIVLFY